MTCTSPRFGHVKRIDGSVMSFDMPKHQETGMEENTDISSVCEKIGLSSCVVWLTAVEAVGTVTSSQANVSNLSGRTLHQSKLRCIRKHRLQPSFVTASL